MKILMRMTVVIGMLLAVGCGEQKGGSQVSSTPSSEADSYATTHKQCAGFAGLTCAANEICVLPDEHTVDALGVCEVIHPI